MGEKLELSAAYRYIVAASTACEYAGLEVKSTDLKASMLSVGLASRW